MPFLKKFPKIEYLTPAYAVVTTMIYIWSMIQFFWRLPSWINFSSIGEILVFYAYTATANLLESLLVLFLTVGILVLLPAAWMRDQWIVKSVLFAAIGLGCLMYRDYYLYPEKVFYELPREQLLYLLIAEALILAAPFNKIPAFCRIIENLADRFIIFLYVTMPVSAASLIVVIVRNLF